MKWHTLVVLLFLLTLVGVLAETNEVTDSAGVLKRAEREKLERLVSEHNARGPGRIRISIVEALPENTSVEAYAVKKINEPPAKAGEKLARVLLLVAIKDRELRIETSREVWGRLTDTESKKIIEEEIVPRFKEGKYFEGMEAGVKAMVKELTAE